MLNVVQEEDVDDDTLTTDTLSPETVDSSHSSDTQVSIFQPLFKQPGSTWQQPQTHLTCFFYYYMSRQFPESLSTALTCVHVCV